MAPAIRTAPTTFVPCGAKKRISMDEPPSTLRRRDGSRPTGAGITPAASDTLEDAGGTLPGSDAHRHHSVPEIASAQREDDGRGADRAGGAERMAEGDRAAHRIDLRRIQADRVDDGERLRSERLVQLDPAHVVELQAGIAQRRRNRLDRADAH